jgi:hypothetical protein
MTTTTLSALLAAELDPLTGAAQLERVAELLRAMAESFPAESDYRNWLLVSADDFSLEAA